jgi:hypothetical protein
MLAALAVTLAYLGYVDQAGLRLNEALSEARRLRQAPTLAEVLRDTVSKRLSSLLAATRPAYCNPELESAAVHRVRHDSSASLEDRQPYHRAREPHSYRTRLMLPGGRDVQSCRAQAATIWTISQRGDDAPLSPDPFTPNASTASSTQPICRAWRAERPSVPRKNSPSDHASACIRWARNIAWAGLNRQNVTGHERPPGRAS